LRHGIAIAVPADRPAMSDDAVRVRIEESEEIISDRALARLRAHVDCNFFFEESDAIDTSSEHHIAYSSTIRVADD
jgi:hypothetical protein